MNETVDKEAPMYYTLDQNGNRANHVTLAKYVANGIDKDHGYFAPCLRMDKRRFCAGSFPRSGTAMWILAIFLPKYIRCYEAERHPLNSTFGSSIIALAIIALSIGGRLSRSDAAFTRVSEGVYLGN